MQPIISSRHDNVFDYERTDRTHMEAVSPAGVRDFLFQATH